MRWWIIWMPSHSQRMLNKAMRKFLGCLLDRLARQHQTSDSWLMTPTLFLFFLAPELDNALCSITWRGFSIMYDVRSMRSPSMQMVTTVAEWGAAPVRQKRNLEQQKKKAIAKKLPKAGVMAHEHFVWKLRMGETEPFMQNHHHCRLEIYFGQRSFNNIFLDAPHSVSATVQIWRACPMWVWHC